jgi:sugar/nucleoside kinase (ribokinase family)
MSVVVLGDANIDLEIQLPVEARATHANPDPELSGGGSAANTADALGRLGVPTRFVGAVGDDAAGRHVVESLAQAGVDTSAVQTVRTDPTVMVIVVLPPDGDRLIYVWPPRGGAHAHLDVERAVDAVEDAEWVHVSGICLRVTPARHALLAAMERAQERGTPVSLDLNLRLENWGWEDGFRDVVLEAVDRADVVLGSAADEITALGDAEDPVTAARHLPGYDRLIVARLGANGSMAITDRDVTTVPGFDVPVVDTVGAGDAFNAGFIAASLEHRSIEEALTWGNAVAATTISRRGARSGPSRDEVMSLLAR